MSGVPFDPAAIRALAAILNETGLTEIEIAEQDRRIRIKRGPAPAQRVSLPHGPPPEGPAEPAASEDLTRHPGAVLSPMVGVVYLAPEPGAPAFVTLGQRVEIGQTLLLIEAMKTFNQIKATKAGEVSRILVRAGAPVEFGEPLMLIE